MNARKGLTLAISLAFIGAAVSALVSVAGQRVARAAKVDQQQQESLKDDLRKLMFERMAVATQFCDATQAAYEAGTTMLDVLMVACRDARDAALANAATIDGEIAIHEAHLTKLKQIERKIAALWMEGSKGGSQMEYSQAQFERQSAEIDLLKARIKKNG